MTALTKMTQAIRTNRETGAVSIEYLAIALVVAVVVGIVIAAASGIDLTGPFQDAVNSIFDN